MGKEDFVQKSLDELIERDGDIQKFFVQGDGSPLEENVLQERRGSLEQAINASYEKHGKVYGNESFVHKYIATPLRYIAGGLYTVGTVMFFGLPGPAGFGLHRLGVVASGLADLIDGYSYAKAGKIKKKGLMTAWGEGIMTKGMAYFFPGAGLIDLYRGRKKFKNRMDAEEDVEKILYHAKGDFIRGMEGRGRILPLSGFRDPQYAATG